MRYKRCNNDRIYGFGIYIPKEHYNYCAGRYTKKLGTIADWTIKKNPEVGRRGLHLSIKYIGYRKNYSKKYVEKLIPELKKIAKKYLPLKIEVKGIKISSSKYDSLGVLLNCKSNPKISKLHKEIIFKLGKKMDFFEYSEGKNFRQHIVIASCPSNNHNLKLLRELARNSKNDKLTEIICRKLYITYRSGMKII